MTGTADVEQRLRRTRLLLLDVDGVLTDGRLVYGPGGDEGRLFHVRDGSAIKLAQAAGLLVGIITGRKTAATARWAQDIGLTIVEQGQRAKLPTWQRVLASQGVGDDEAAYMGDDVLDLPVLERVGLSACPADALREVRARVDFVSRSGGGNGAARELVELVLKAQRRWQKVTRELMARAGRRVGTP
jgi:3-deoxy-D-manno-octulosonate 8-phosphate phosphatase (KDO 8-P phosphatase)